MAGSHGGVSSRDYHITVLWPGGPAQAPCVKSKEQTELFCFLEARGAISFFTSSIF